MAVAKHNTRYPVTLHKDLVKTIRDEAERLGIAGSQLATFIIETHFETRNLYTPEITNWRESLRATYVPPALLNSPSQLFPDEA